MAEPGELALGILPRLDLRRLDCFFQGHRSSKERDGLSISQRLERLLIAGSSLGDEPPHFLEQALPEHRLRPRIEPGVQSRPLGIQTDPDDREFLERLGGFLRRQFGT